MIRYLTVREVFRLHALVLDQSGGSQGIRDRGALESAIAQPMATFGGEDLYDTIPKKAGALAFSLVRNHAFVDGNKRIGHAAMEVFLMLNGFKISAGVDEQEDLILSLAAGGVSREVLTEWIEAHLQAIS